MGKRTRWLGKICLLGEDSLLDYCAMGAIEQEK